MNTANKDEIERGLSLAWHEETARNSVERWFKVCEQEHWQDKPENLQLLISIFGASWYFTRFIFATGLQAVEVIDRNNAPPPDRDTLTESLLPSLAHDDIEIRTNQLRVLKNKSMLQILKAYLQADYTIEQLEHSLTLLAEATLDILIRSLRMLPQHAQFPVTILAMGRMAGHEMTFGSDLDLIFLYDEKHQDLHASMGKTIRLLLRTIAQPASAGSLYDVDMRLRPHGNSGLLVTSYSSFIEYHDDKRDVWERQMMTRCRPVLVSSDYVDNVMQHVFGSIYAEYDKIHLKQEILAMRTRVQKELGSPKDKYEIKRGYGGIMDVDFISHYYQLAHGYQHSELRTCSTRTALAALGNIGLIDKKAVARLTEHYNYLKKVEMCLRLFDLKSVDSFRTFAADNLALSRALGHGDNTGQFIEEYESVVQEVRRDFQDLLD